MADSYSTVSSPPSGGQPSTTEARTNRDSIKKGFSDIVKFADVSFSRARQVSGKILLEAVYTVHSCSS